MFLRYPLGIRNSDALRACRMGRVVSRIFGLLMALTDYVTQQFITKFRVRRALAIQTRMSVNNPAGNSSSALVASWLL